MLKFIIFLQNIFSSAGLHRIHSEVQDVQQSKNFQELVLWHATTNCTTMKLNLWELWSAEESFKRQYFLNKLQTQQPITLSNLRAAPSTMVFLNKGKAIQDAPPHSIHFSFIPLVPMTPTSVDTIFKHHNSGNFTVSGCTKWLEEPLKPEHATITNSISK